MDNFEYDFTEPTQSHIGQVVEVRNDENSRWSKGKLIGFLDDDFSYAIRCDHAKAPSFWKMARLPVRLSYVERQKRCDIKVGDLVKIKRMPESREDEWGDTTVPKMQELVGTCHKVTYDGGRFGFKVGGFYFPYFVLQKETKRAKDLIDGEIVYTDNNEWIQVIPRKGNFTPCDRYTSLSNEYNRGWIKGNNECNNICRPARLLKSPSFSVESIGKTVFCVDTPNEKGRIIQIWVCADGLPSAQVGYALTTKAYNLNQLLVLED